MRCEEGMINVYLSFLKFILWHQALLFQLRGDLETYSLEIFLWIWGSHKLYHRYQFVVGTRNGGKICPTYSL